MDFMRQVALQNKTNKPNKTINNIRSLNIYFIVNEYDEALNYEDRMRDPITKKERKGIIRYGGIQGCYNILYNRCIKDITLDKRPFHCVDESRSKYVLRTKDKWEIDKGAVEILEGIYPRVVQICAPKKMKDISEWKRYNKENNRMIELSKGKGKILKKLNEVSLLKNNMVLDK